MEPKLKHNRLKEGLKADKRLKNSFYRFIYEKHIDWAIILAAFFVLLPYVASVTWYFLISKLIILAIILYLMGKYLLTWNGLQQYYKVEEDWNYVRKKLINPDKIESATAMLRQLTAEIEKVPEKAEKKLDMYKSFTEYLKYDKVDFIPIEEIINKDKDTAKTAFGSMLTVLLTILVLRELPAEEYKNYRRILAILILTAIFFVIYTIDFWFSK